MLTKDCPRCGGQWHADLDEDGRPYTCYCCCNGTINKFEEEENNDNNNSSILENAIPV